MRAGQPPHKQKQLLKTLSSSQLDRDQASSSSPSTSNLVTAEQEKVPGVQHHHHLTVQTAARCSASGEHSQIML